jgi:hypothetical protein
MSVAAATIVGLVAVSALADPSANVVSRDAEPVVSAETFPRGAEPHASQADNGVDSQQGDVVQSIVPGDEADKSAPAHAGTRVESSAPSPADRVQLGGWARESMEWTLASAGFRQGAPNPLDVPHDRLISRTQLFARASYARGKWFEATLSGVIGYSLREQGTADGSNFDGVNGQATTGESQSELRELYVGLYSARVDLRIGQQRVAWGRADLQSPNDVLNARDLRDPILIETELRHIPTPILRLDVDWNAISIELVGTPVFVPDAYDVYGTNWSVVQQDATPAIRTQLSSLWSQIDPTKQGQFGALVHDTGLPPSNWAAPSGGAKISTALAGIDLDAYYHYGFDSTPYVAVGSSFAALFGAPLAATYVRRHHVGLDAVATAGPFVMRLDAAYETARVYYNLAFMSISSPTVLGVVSVEYQTGDVEKAALVELIYNFLVDAPEAQLLGYDRYSYAVASTLRWPIAGRVGIDLRGVTGIAPVSFVLEPALRWNLNDAVLLKAGTVLLGGEEGSVGWYYRRNGSAFVQAKYSF